MRVTVDGELIPEALPRVGAAPAHFTLDTKIASVDGSVPPQLRRISVEINRNGHLEPNGLPVCSLDAIQPSTTAGALAACRRSLVGEGHFAAKVLIAQQAPFPSDGRVVAFNGRRHGRPAILAHVYGTEPLPTSFTLPFLMTPLKGTYGTLLSAALPEVTGNSSYITGLSLELGRNFTAAGSRHSFLSAGCPAPKGFPGATFPFGHAAFVFAGGERLSSAVTGNCRVSGG